MSTGGSKNIYLNQAGTSWPKPEPVRRAVSEAFEAPIGSWAERLDSQHRAVCDFFGVSRPDRLLLTPGATSALSAAILDHDWEPGDQLLTSSFEHHAVVRPTELLAARGVEVVAIPPADGSVFALEALRAELAKGKTRLVAVTAASNVTGDVLPCAEIVEAAREFEALSLVDASQVAGWIPVDVTKMGADLLVFTAHKALQGVWGMGGLYVSPSVTMASPNAICELPTDGGRPDCAPMPGYCDVGSVDRAALAGLVAGMEWLSDPSRSDRLDRGRKSVAEVESTLRELESVVVHGYAQPEDRLPTLAFTVEGRDPSDLASQLAASGVIASGGFQCAAQAHETLGTASDGVLRLSFGPGNASQDTDDTIGVLRDVLQKRSRSH